MKKKVIMITVFTVVIFFIFQNKIFASEIDKYDLDTYKSYLGKTDIFSKSINFVVNLFFSFSKFVFSCLDFLVKELLSMNIINAKIDEFSKYSHEIWVSMYNNIGLSVFIISVVYIFCVYAFKGSQFAFRYMMILIGVLLIGFIWSDHSAKVLKGFNNLVRDAQTTIMASTKIAEANEDITANIRNVYFDAVVKRPFLLMNYGTADETKINFENPKRSTSLLRTEIDDNTFSDIEEYINKNEKNNMFLRTEKLEFKFVVAWLSPLLSLLMSIPIVVAAFMSFLYQIIVLLLSLLVPFAVIIGMIPKGSGILFNLIKKIFGALLMQLPLAFFVLFFYFIYNVITWFIPVNSAAEYIIQNCFVFLSLVIIYKKRDTIIKNVTNGMVKTVDSGVGDKIKEKINYLKNKTKQAAMVAAGVPPVDIGSGNDIKKGKEVNPNMPMDINSNLDLNGKHTDFERNVKFDDNVISDEKPSKFKKDDNSNHNKIYDDNFVESDILEKKDNGFERNIEKDDKVNFNTDPINDIKDNVPYVEDNGFERNIEKDDKINFNTDPINDIKDNIPYVEDNGFGRNIEKDNKVNIDTDPINDIKDNVPDVEDIEIDRGVEIDDEVNFDTDPINDIKDNVPDVEDIEIDRGVEIDDEVNFDPDLINDVKDNIPEVKDIEINRDVEINDNINPNIDKNVPNTHNIKSGRNFEIKNNVNSEIASNIIIDDIQRENIGNIEEEKN